MGLYTEGHGEAAPSRRGTEDFLEAALRASEEGGEGLPFHGQRGWRMRGSQGPTRRMGKHAAGILRQQNVGVSAFAAP